VSEQSRAMPMHTSAAAQAFRDVFPPASRSNDRLDSCAGNGHPWLSEPSSRHSVGSLTEVAGIVKDAHWMVNTFADKEEETKARKAHWVIDSRLFKGVVYSAILVNTITMGLATDNPEPPYDTYWLVCDNIFTSVFTGEMLCKVWVLGYLYFRDAWNCLDFFIVLCAVVDTWIMQFVIQGETTGLNMLLLIKTVRMVRLVRMVKLLKVFRKLLILIEGIINSLQSMFWVCVLLLFVLYISSIFCVEMIRLSDYPATNVDKEAIEEEVLGSWNSELYFGSVLRAMFSLLSVCLLTEWSTIGRPVMFQQPLFFPFFLVFIVFMTLGLMNVIVGVIVENTMAATTKVEKEDLRRERDKKLEKISALRAMIYRVDTGGDGVIDEAEMQVGMENDREMRALLKDVELPHGFNPRDLLTMLDDDGSGHVNEDEFLEVMSRLIYCNEFQQLCLLKLSLNQIKAMVQKQTDHLADLVLDSNNHVAREIASLRLQLSSGLSMQLMPLTQIMEESSSWQPPCPQSAVDASITTAKGAVAQSVLSAIGAATNSLASDSSNLGIHGVLGSASRPGAAREGRELAAIGRVPNLPIGPPPPSSLDGFGSAATVKTTPRDGGINSSICRVPAPPGQCMVPPLALRGGEILAGGYRPGQKVYFTGLDEAFPNGDCVGYGTRGDVTGPCDMEECEYWEDRVNVGFPGNDANVSCSLLELSRSQPPPRPDLSSLQVSSDRGRTGHSVANPGTGVSSVLDSRGYGSPSLTCSGLGLRGGPALGSRPGRIVPPLMLQGILESNVEKHSAEAEVQM